MTKGISGKTKKTNCRYVDCQKPFNSYAWLINHMTKVHGFTRRALPISIESFTLVPRSSFIEPKQQKEEKE